MLGLLWPTNTSQRFATSYRCIGIRTENLPHSLKLWNWLENLDDWGKGINWVFHLMTHLYASIACTIQSSSSYLQMTLHKFRELIKQLRNSHKQLTLEQDVQHINKVNFAIKKAMQQTYKSDHLSFMNQTLHKELDLLTAWLQLNSGIRWSIPFAHMIPCSPDTKSPTPSKISLRCILLS